MLRIQIASDKVGALVLDGSDFGLDDPKGLDTLEQTVKRSEENDGVVYEITLSLDWAKKAREFIAAAYEIDGIEAVVIVNLYDRDVNARKWELYYTGKLDMNKYSITETLVTLPISQISTQTKVLNLMETDVDLETVFSQSGSALPVTPTVDLEFHAKTIQKGYDASPIDGNLFQQLNVMGEDYPFCTGSLDPPFNCTRGYDYTAFGSIDLNAVRSKELDGIFTYPWGYSLTNINEIYAATEAGILDIDISLRLKHTITHALSGGDIDFCGDDSSKIPNKDIQAWYRHTSSDGTIITETSFGTWASNVGCGSTGAVGVFETKTYQQLAVNIAVGDKIFVYFTVRLYGDYTQSNLGAAGRIDHHLTVQAEPEFTFVTISQSTVFPATNHKSVMIYEALNKMVQYYTDQVDSFKSDFFGRTDTTPAYAADGPGSLMAITNGRILRALANLKMFANLDEAFKTLTAHWCLGMGFETTDGVTRVVIEGKEHFYNKNSLTLELGRVQDIKKEVSMKHYYAQVEMSNPKLDAGQVNGVDEPNTIRRLVAPLTQAKAKLSLKSLWRSSGYEIEAQRRLQGQTKDSRNDDSIFMAMVVRDGMTFKTERNEAFDSVTGLFDPDSAYNLRITPMRNLRRWLIVLAAPLWAVVNKVYRFTYGETNFTMTSKLTSEAFTVAEDGNLDANNTEPLWLPEIYSFKSPLTRSEFKLVRQKPYGFIRFRDNLDNVMDGFMLEVSHKPNEKLGDFKLLRVFRNV